jgi:hypothetical protein
MVDCECCRHWTQGLSGEVAPTRSIPELRGGTASPASTISEVYVRLTPEHKREDGRTGAVQHRSCVCTAAGRRVPAVRWFQVFPVLINC